MLPTFVVVGRVNEGKSSIVAALTETADIPIAPTPGTTQHATAYTVADGRGTPLFCVYDTPGFQQPEAVFGLIQPRAATAAERPEAVRRFLRDVAAGDLYEDERRLLGPIMDGAVVLYVVDASHPFRANYELEMQILQWTGQPRFALLNRTGPDDHSPEWDAALRQYFAVVRPFNAHSVRLADRLNLLAMLGEMNEALRDALALVVTHLRQGHAERLAAAAALIADAVVQMASLTISEPAPKAPVPSADIARLEQRFQRDIARLEAECRRRVEALFRYRRPVTSQAPLASPLYDRDIFATETYRLLGLTRWQLIGAGAAAGSGLGALVDVATGFHSLGAGLALGGLFGSATAAYAVMGDPEVRPFNLRLGGKELTIGPHRDLNFGWILLDRALLHAEAVIGRSHARADQVSLGDGTAKVGPTSRLGGAQRERLAAVFAALQRGRAPAPDKLAAMRRTIAAVLAQG